MLTLTNVTLSEQHKAVLSANRGESTLRLKSPGSVLNCTFFFLASTS